MATYTGNYCAASIVARGDAAGPERTRTAASERPAQGRTVGSGSEAVYTLGTAPGHKLTLKQTPDT